MSCLFSVCLEILSLSETALGFPNWVVGMLDISWMASQSQGSQTFALSFSPFSVPSSPILYVFGLWGKFAQTRGEHEDRKASN